MFLSHTQEKTKQKFLLRPSSTLIPRPSLIFLSLFLFLLPGLLSILRESPTPAACQASPKREGGKEPNLSWTPSPPSPLSGVTRLSLSLSLICEEREEEGATKGKRTQREPRPPLKHLESRRLRRSGAQEDFYRAVPKKERRKTNNTTRFPISAAEK